MKIEHLAIWATDIEKLKDFYCKYFGAVSNELYFNKTKNFRSYFLSFKECCRLEVMQMPGIEAKSAKTGKQFLGIAHFAISVGDKQKVDSLTEMLRNDGFVVAGEPRITGDGYYESVVLDPEGNRIEITI
jgi:lactoylglutathione lyase